MIANFAGRCQICHEPIHAGDSITIVENEWVHDECAEEYVEEDAA